MEINELLRYAVERGASDLHLKVGNVPFIRVDGDLQPTAFPALTPADTEAFGMELMSDHKKREFEETSEADLGVTLAGVGRFRVNVFRQRGVVGLAIRRVRSEIPSFEELRLPEVMRTLADSPRGLVLITGPTGTGKTTTIASMIGHINNTRRTHIVTVEDPIEVVHDDALSIVQQREIGIDTNSYANALRHVIRQDPDVIFIGEIRDPESALSAIQAAETGHLVISTLHTIDCVETINRLLDLFPPSQQREVRSSFAGSLRGIVAQRLVPARRRQGPRAGRRGADQHRPHLRPDRGSRRDRFDPRGDRRRRLLRDADVRPGVGEAREGRARRGGRGAAHVHQPARLRPGADGRHGSPVVDPARTRGRPDASRRPSFGRELSRRPHRAELHRVALVPVRDRQAEVHGDEQRAAGRSTA